VPKWQRELGMAVAKAAEPPADPTLGPAAFQQSKKRSHGEATSLSAAARLKELNKIVGRIDE
jgi:hypothetical protein